LQDRPFRAFTSHKDHLSLALRFSVQNGVQKAATTLQRKTRRWREANRRESCVSEMDGAPQRGERRAQSVTADLRFANQLSHLLPLLFITEIWQDAGQGIERVESEQQLMPNGSKFGVCVFLVAIGLMLAGLHPAAGAPSPAAQALQWSPCPDIPDTESAGIAVPVDPARPEGPRFTLRIGRIPALDPAQRKGVLLFLPGGPGPGIAKTIGGDGRAANRVDEFRHQWDVLSFDPRGLEQSNRSAAHRSSNRRRQRRRIDCPRRRSSRRLRAPTRCSSTAAPRRRAS
jgi:hypothetical protein